MEIPEYSKQVLEAINHLRMRKARPDISRIMNYLLKRYGIPSEIVVKSMAECVKERIVLQVEYKGFISYRNASKMRNGKRPTLKDNVPILMLKTFEEIRKSIPDLSEIGLGITEFKEILLDMNIINDDKEFEEILELSIKDRIFTILPNQNIIASKYIKHKVEGIYNLKTEIKEDLLKNRLSPKKIEDEFLQENIESINDNNLYKIEKTLSHSVANDDDTEDCVMCRKHLKRARYNESVIKCKQCLNKCHFKCLYNINFNNIDYIFEWNCPKCIICAKCRKRTATVPLITCANCNIAYHRHCYNPKLQDSLYAQSFWICNACSDTVDATAKSSYFCTPGFTPILKYEPREHIAIWKHFKPRTFEVIQEEEEIENSIPDVSSWSSDQIYKYLCKKIPPKDALTLRERDINGSHLLSMSRTEVLQGLGLKLGPALKVFKEIIILQNRRNSSKLYYL